MSVGEPAANGDGVLRVEDVGRRGVVDYNSFTEVAADLGEILYSTSESFPFQVYDKRPRENTVIYLDVVALVVVAAFAKESVMHNAMDIKLIEKRITVLFPTSACFRA